MHPLHLLCIRSFRYSSTLRLSLVTPSELPSTSIRYASDERTFNIPAAYYTHVRCFPFCFRQSCPFLERMKTDGATSEMLLVRCVLIMHTFCVHRPVGPAFSEIPRVQLIFRASR